MTKGGKTTQEERAEIVAFCIEHNKDYGLTVDQHEFKIVDISTPNVDESIPEYIFSKIPQLYYIKIEVAEYQKARLYFNQKLERILDAGTYYFWKTSTKVRMANIL